MLVVDVKTGGCQVFLCVFYCELQAMPTALTASALISVVEAAAETCKKSQKHLAVGETSHDRCHEVEIVHRRYTPHTTNPR